MPRTLDDLDAWARDHELRHVREVSERREKDAELIDAVKKHVDTAFVALRDVPKQLEALKGVNDEQLAIARESAEERGRRMQREADAAAKKSEEQLALERVKVEALERTQKDTSQIELLKARNSRWQIIAGVVSAIAVAIIGALIARHR